MTAPLLQKLNQKHGTEPPKSRPKPVEKKNGSRPDYFKLANDADTGGVLDHLGIDHDEKFATCPGCGESGALICRNGGIACRHDRCADAGPKGNEPKPGFRTNVDLVMHVNAVDKFEAVKRICEWNGTKVPERAASVSEKEMPAAEPWEPTDDDAPNAPPKDVNQVDDVNLKTNPEPADESLQKTIPLITLGSLIGPALERAARRQDHTETPIPVPYPGWGESLGGGLWPGAHFVVSGTGVGKSQMILQTAVGAAKAGIPTAYIGLELDAMSIALRALGVEIGARWSSMYLGRCSTETLDRARSAAPLLENLPFYVDFGPPRGWPASRLVALAQSMRQQHPTGPMLIVLDYLQLVGDEPDARRGEPRQRIADAAYVTRDVARRFDASVVVVSSAARNHYGVLSSDAAEAGLMTAKTPGYAESVRTIAHPHVLIGLGKESGDLEFSADTVSVLIRWPTPLDNGERAIVVAVPKVRAGFERWSALAFDGGRFVELDVRGLEELPQPPQKAGKGGRKPTDEDPRTLILGTVTKHTCRSVNDIAKATTVRRSDVYKLVPKMLDEGLLGQVDGVFRNSEQTGNT